MQNKILKLAADGSPFYLRLDSSIYSTSRFGSGWREVIDVTNLTTESACCIEANTVLKNTLEDNYPNGSYQGREFEVRKFAPRDGKQYYSFQIKEIRMAKQRETLPNLQQVPDDIGTFSTDRLSEYYDYRKSQRWKVIKKRIFRERRARLPSMRRKCYRGPSPKLLGSCAGWGR